MDIAIVRRNGLGDLVCTCPLIFYIKKNIPNSKITLFLDSWNAPLATYLPHIHNVVIFPERGNKYWRVLKTASKYRKKFDLSISAKTSPMKLMNYFLFCLKAKDQIAYVDKSWSRHLINRPLLYDPEEAAQKHQALKTLQTLAPHLQTVPQDLYPKIHLPSEVKKKYPLPQFGQPLVLVSATTTREESRLEPLKYCRLLNRLYEKYFFTALIIGQKKDEPRALEISRGLKMEKQLHFPRNFDEFMVWLNAADLFFVGDGGVAHIGAALDKVVLALFGGVDPIQWSPLSPHAGTLYHPQNVNYLSDDLIFDALVEKFNEVSCGRKNL